MNIGFIGAGKVGFSLGKYLASNQHFLCGYYSQNPNSSLKAAEFTQSKQFSNLSDLVKESDIIFLTVPDDRIKQVSIDLINSCKNIDFRDKIFCHCSGVYDHTILSELRKLNAFTFSIHPFLAISDKYTSYQELSNAFFTIEGSKEKIQVLIDLFKSCGNHIQTIKAEDKIKYHTAAVFASNLLVGLVDMASNLLLDCGFEADESNYALANILRNNLENVLTMGSKEALTGPIERDDIETIKAHLHCLTGNETYYQTYTALSKQLLHIATIKHPDRDYSNLLSII